MAPQYSKSRGHVSISKSALLLSGCVTWAHPDSIWYDDRFTDNTDRDIGISFHEQIDQYIKAKRN